MRYAFLLPLLWLATACQPSRQAATTASSPPAADIFPYPIHQQTLDNGLRVVSVPYDSPGLAAFYLVVRVGSREEIEAGKSGFAHFFEHMMFRGTDQYSKAEYGAALKGIGAAANANTWWDRTVYHMTGNAAALDQMFELEADRFRYLNYSEADFKVEAGAVKGEYTKGYASPSSKLYEKTYQTAFEQHTYQHTTIGFWEDIVDMPNQYDYSLEFFDRFYRPEYTTVLVVGDVTPARVDSLAERYFGTWERGSYRADIPTEPAQTETRYAHVEANGYPPYVGLYYKGPAFSVAQKDKAALDLFAAVAFSEKSPLYQKLVIEEQKVRRVGAYGLDKRDPGLFSLTASVVNADDLAYVKSELESTVARYQRELADPAELAAAQQRLRYGFAMQLNSPTNIAEALSEMIWLTGDPTDVNRLYELYASVTPEDIRRAVQKYLVSERLTVGTIAPTKASPFRQM